MIPLTVIPQLFRYANTIGFCESAKRHDAPKYIRTLVESANMNPDNIEGYYKMYDDDDYLISIIYGPNGFALVHDVFYDEKIGKHVFLYFPDYFLNASDEEIFDASLCAVRMIFDQIYPVLKRKKGDIHTKDLFGEGVIFDKIIFAAFNVYSINGEISDTIMESSHIPKEYTKETIVNETRELSKLLDDFEAAKRKISS